MSKIYNIDLTKLAVLVLLRQLRKTKVVTWIKVLITPIKSLHFEFNKKRLQDIYKLEHNGQVCYLRKALNDSFDNDLRRIEIVDGNRFKAQYIYTDPEKKDKYLGNMYLRDDSVFEDTGVDFLVLVPLDVWDRYKIEVSIGEYKFYEIEAVVDFYRLASKRYKIEIK